MFLLQKFHVKKKILQSLGGCQSWQLWNISYSYPLLVNLEYLFLNQSSSFEIWYTCCQHNNDFVSKISCINKKFPALGRVSKLAAMWALSLELHKVPISLSPHCTIQFKVKGFFITETSIETRSKPWINLLVGAKITRNTVFYHSSWEHQT